MKVVNQPPLTFRAATTGRRAKPAAADSMIGIPLWLGAKLMPRPSEKTACRMAMKAKAQPDERVPHREAQHPIAPARAENLVVARIMADEAQLSERHPQQRGHREGRPRVAARAEYTARGYGQGWSSETAASAYPA